MDTVSVERFLVGLHDLGQEGGQGHPYDDDQGNREGQEGQDRERAEGLHGLCFFPWV